jgi:hypothetical protein
MVHSSLEEMQFGLRRAVLYHTDREGFFFNLNCVLFAVAIALGASVVAKLASYLGWNELWLEFPLVLILALQAWGQFERKAAYHRHMKNRANELLADLIGEGRLSEKALRKVRVKFFAAGAEEPNVKRAAYALAHNKTVESRTPNDEEYERYKKVVRWWHILFRHLVTFHGSTFPSAWMRRKNKQHGVKRDIVPGKPYLVSPETEASEGVLPLPDRQIAPRL